MAAREKLWTFKEIDSSRGECKGSAFLAFKQLRDSFDEGRDYYYLSAAQDTREIERLRASGRLYATTVNAVVLTENGYHALLDYLDG